MKYGPLGRLFRHKSTHTQNTQPRRTSRRISQIKPAEDILDFQYPESSAFYQGERDEPTS